MPRCRTSREAARGRSPFIPPSATAPCVAQPPASLQSSPPISKLPCLSGHSRFAPYLTTFIDPRRSVPDNPHPLWWPASVPPQRKAVNPVRPGREQPQQWSRVPGCGCYGPPPFQAHASRSRCCHHIPFHRETMPLLG